MKTYANDWKIFELIRKRYGINKPFALEWEEWDKWYEQTKKDKPIAYFFSETVPDWIDNITNYIPTPISDIRYYCRNRFYRKTHILPTGFTPGQYHDLDERILYGIMNSLVDFVEVELAYKSRWCNTEESKKAKWKNGRCAELGLAHLAWEMTLDDPKLDEYNRCDSQAAIAREVKAIYDWWKITRPARPDVHDASGWSALCDEKRDNGLGVLQRGDEDYERRSHESLKIMRKLEKEYDDEDEAMLIRVIRCRKSLWA